jgi:hypothetical protein
VSVVRTVEVPVDPETAFRMFTEEIDDWYERGRYSWNDPERAVAIRFEGGRLLEVWNDGGAFEMGVVTMWEPGEQLAFAYRACICRRSSRRRSRFDSSRPRTERE